MAKTMAAADRLSRTLDEWRHWDLPAPLTHAPLLGPLLAQGSGHAIYEILCSPPLIGRIRHQSTRLAETAFGTELTAWKAAALQGIAPGVVFCDPAEQAIICQRVAPLDAPVSGRALGQLCHRIHQLPALSDKLTLRSDIGRYLERLPDHLSRAWRSVMRAGGVEDAMTRLEQDTPCLCHNDLTAGNLMREGNELVAIDWEYAAMGSRYFDVAIAAECLSSAERVLMVNEVFGAAADEALMNAGDCIASLVTALWEHQYATAQAPDPSTWLNGRGGA